VAFRELRQDKDFFDVTLTCEDDQQLEAHKVILSACSPFFRNILRRNPHAHPLLYLKGVKYTDLQSVLNFMNHGEVNVAQEELNSFLAVAEDLRVKGLTQNQPTSNNSSGGGGVGSSSSNKSSGQPRSPLASSQKASRPPDTSGGGGQPPPPKRPRPSAAAPQSSAAYSIKKDDAGGGGSEGEEDDDDIQEVVPVKSEPRDTAAGAGLSAGGVMVAGGGGPVSGAVAEDSYSNALVTDEAEGYDESYEDYGQYDQSFGGGGGDGSLVDLGPDGNKGKRRRRNFFVWPSEGQNLPHLFSTYIICTYIPVFVSNGFRVNSPALFFSLQCSG
jgi:hypothetical protein